MEFYIAVFIFAVSTTITPGPNNIMIMTSGLNYGIKSSMPHLLGICLGFPTMVLLVGLGFSVVFERYPVLHEVIKLMGIAYLLYLSWIVASSSPASLEGKQNKPFSFAQAALFQWVNPKAWIMATGAVSAFTSVSSDLLPQVIIISLLFLLVAFPCVGVWLVFGVSLKKYLTSFTQQKIFNVSMALLLTVSVLPALKDVFVQYVF